MSAEGHNTKLVKVTMAHPRPQNSQFQGRTLMRYGAGPTAWQHRKP